MTHKAINILVAEDNDLNAALIAAILSRDTYSLTFAKSGIEAVAACEKGAFDLILMDLRMPGMDGFEATTTIRDGETPNHNSPIIAITADAISGQAKRCEDLGMNAYFTKPVDPQKLIQKISDLTYAL